MKLKVTAVAVCLLLLCSAPAALAQDDWSPPGLDQALESLGYHREFVEMLTRDHKLALIREGKLTENKLNNYLAEAGYPAEVVEVLDYTQKVDLYLHQAEYYDHHVEYDHISDGEEEIGLQLSNFSHWFTFSTVSYPNPDYIAYMVYYNWQWNTRPVVTLTDKIGMSWERIDNWILYDVYRCYVARGNSNDYYYYSRDISDWGANGTAVGWSFDIKSSVSGDTINRHSGWGRVMLRRRVDSIRSGVTEVVGRYFHKLVGPCSSLVFEAYGTAPNVNILASYRYSQSSLMISYWSWRHP